MSSRKKLDDKSYFLLLILVAGSAINHSKIVEYILYIIGALILINIQLAVAKKYTDNLREEAMKGWAEKLSQGWLPTVPPPGYKTITYNGKRIHVPDPETSFLMKKAFEMYLDSSHSISSVAVELDKLGLRTRKGRPYAKSHRWI